MTRLHRSIAFLGCGALAVGALLTAPRVHAQEPAACLSSNPAAWPAASRPYFLLVVDTSGSMIGCTNPSPAPNYQWPNSCPSSAPKNSSLMEPTRLNDAKCALRNTVQAFGGEVNFGMATFPVRLSGCAGACGDKALLNKGSTLHRLGRYQEALETFDKVLKINYRLEKVHNNKGATLHAMGKIAEALASYNRAIELKHDYIERVDEQGQLVVRAGEVR